jgi:hypothetical protein
VPGIVLAWLVGEGILTWRSFKQDHRPPLPGQLLAASGIFVMLGLLAEAQQARFLAGALAWGFDVAALMNVLPQVATGGTGQAAGKTTTAKAGTG